MGKKLRSTAFTLGLFVLVVGYVIWDSMSFTPPPDQPQIDATTLAPDWPAIAAWPAQEIEGVAEPDPGRVTTVVLFDDSGSMERDIGAAKRAVTAAIAQMPAADRVGVLALNGGLVLNVMPVSAIGDELRAAMGSVVASGATPLGERLADAHAILATEAARVGGVGVFRILVTTDGAASDFLSLNDSVTAIVSRTPIEIATIGLGVGEGHALNMPGFTDYVSVDKVEDLAAALQAATAEQTSFDPITSFSE